MGRILEADGRRTLRPGVEHIRNRSRILFIETTPKQNYETLGKGSAADWFVAASGLTPSEVDVVWAAEGEIPASHFLHSGVVIGGSPHSAYENLPWITALKDFIRGMKDQQKPILGICFGHQVIAEALGGKVEKGKKGREIGAVNIQIKDEGENHVLFQRLPKDIVMATSHSDVVTRLPQDAVELARNSRYANQALAIGNNIQTIQPHPEMTCDIVASIAQMRKDALIQEGVTPEQDFSQFIAATRAQKALERNGQKILRNFYASLS